MTPPPPSEMLVEQEQVQPKRKRRKKKGARLDLNIDPSLPEEKRLLTLIERSLKLEYERKYANASSGEREEFEESMLRVLDYLQSKSEANTEDLNNPQNSDKYKSNPANDELEKREAQLKAIAASYEKELAQWEAVQGNAEQAEITAAELPEASDDAKLESIANVDEVLASSTRAVEAYILQTDHIRAVVKQLESRNRKTKTCIQDIASRLNDTVMAEFGNGNVGEMIPPAGLAAVETKDLAV